MDVLPTVIFVTNLITEKMMMNADYINLIEILVVAMIGDINSKWIQLHQMEYLVALQLLPNIHLHRLLLIQ